MNGTQYWLKIKLPGEFDKLTMTQLTALRKMIVKAFNEGKKNERH